VARISTRGQDLDQGPGSRPGARISTRGQDLDQGPGKYRGDPVAQLAVGGAPADDAPASGLMVGPRFGGSICGEAGRGFYRIPRSPQVLFPCPEKILQAVRLPKSPSLQPPASSGQPPARPLVRAHARLRANAAIRSYLRPPNSFFSS